MLPLTPLDIHLNEFSTKLKVVHSNCKTIAFMFNGGNGRSIIFCLIDTRIYMVLLHY